MDEQGLKGCARRNRPDVGVWDRPRVPEQTLSHVKGIEQVREMEGHESRITMDLRYNCASQIAEHK